MPQIGVFILSLLTNARWENLRFSINFPRDETREEEKLSARCE